MIKRLIKLSSDSPPIMKKHIILTIGALCSLYAQAQTINFNNGGVTYSFPAAVAVKMGFADEAVTVAERSFPFS